MATKQENSKTNYVSIVIAVALLLFPFVKTDADSLIDFGLLPKQLFAGIVAIALLILSLRNKSKAPLLNLATGGYLLFLIAHFLSMTSAINMAEAWGTTSRNLIYGGLLFALVSGFYNQKLDMNIIAKGATIFLLIVGLVALPDIIEAYKAKDPLQALYGLKKMYVHKNFMASALLLATPLAAMGLMDQQKPWRIASIIALSIALLDIALLRTRSVYLALVISFIAVVVLFFVLSKNAEDSRKLLKYIGLGLGGFALVTILVFSTTKISESLLNTSNLDLRLNYWNASVEMAKESPVTGIGAGNWRINFVKQGLHGLNKSIIDGYTTINRPHNDILWVLSETGVIGLVGFLSFLIFSFLFNIRAALRSEEKNTKLIYILSAAGILIFVIYGLFEFPLERPEHMVFLMVFSAIGISGYLRTQTSPKLKLSNQLVIGVLIIPTVFSVYVVNTRLASAKEAKIAVDGYTKRVPRVMIKAGRAAAQPYYGLDDFGNPVAFFEGMGQLASQKLGPAEKAFARALEAHPYHILSNIQMGNTLRNANRLAEAETFYGRAIDVSPLNEMARLNRAEVRLAQNNWLEALGDLRVITPKPNDLRYMNAVKQTMSEYYKNPPQDQYKGMNSFLKGARNLDDLTERFINWRRRAIDKQNNINNAKY